jgi:hypothetical protein
MIDQCQYCGHYGYLQRRGAVYLCAHCRRKHGDSIARHDHEKAGRGAAQRDAG